MRDKYSRFNTHIKSVKGITTTTNSVMRERLEIRFTSDTHETLSIANDRIQFSVSYDDVLKLVEETRADYKKGIS